MAEKGSDQRLAETEKGSDHMLAELADSSAANSGVRLERVELLVEEIRVRLTAPAEDEPGEQHPDPDEAPPAGESHPEFDPTPPA